MEEGKALTAERHDGGGISATAAKTDAFAVMMQSSRKERQRNTPAKRTATHMSQGVRTQLHSVADARVEMGAMGFRAEAVEHAVKLHAHGCGIDLEHAVASCIAFSETDKAEPADCAAKTTPKGVQVSGTGTDPGTHSCDPREHCIRTSSSHQGEVATVPTCIQDNGVHPSAKDMKLALDAAKAGSGNLCAFLGVTDRSVPPFFFLDWERHSAHFLHSKPLNASVVATVNWRQVKREVQLCTNSADTQAWRPQPESKWGKTHEQLLKSHLQKCVRRSLVSGALESAAALLSFNPNELLQRLGVIIVEDVMLCSAFPVLQWLMAASYKGVPITTGQIHWVLGLVAAAASHPVRDVPHHADACDVAIVAKGVCDERHRSMLYSVLLRRDYKCMAGDKRMFNACTIEWAARLQLHEKRERDARAAGVSARVDRGPHDASAAVAALEWHVTPIGMHAIKPLTLQQFTLAAVDFHCSDVDERVAAATGLSQERVKTVMWRCSSSVTDKEVATWCGRTATRVAAEDEREWLQVHSEFERHARVILAAKGIL